MGNTIIAAARNGAHEAVPELMAQAEDINRRGESAKTAMIIAAEKQDQQFVKALLPYNPDLNLIDELGTTAIGYACLNEDIPMINLLKEAGANLYAAPSAETDHALHCAIQTGHLPTFLAATGLDNEGGDGAAHATIKATVRYLAETVLRIGRDTVQWVDDLKDPQGTPVDLLRNVDGEFQLSNKLFDLNYVHQSYDGSCLLSGKSQNACRCRETRMIGLVLTEKVMDQPRDVRARAHAALMCFLLSNLENAVEIPELGPKSRIDLGFIDHKGATLLHYAAFEGQAEIAKTLLAHGVQVDIRSSEGKTPLHLAAEEGHINIVHLLCDAGADVNALDTWRQTPLFYATFEDHVKVVEVLLKRGAEPDIIAKNKTTPRALAQSPKVKKLFKKLPRSSQLGANSPAVISDSDSDDSDGSAGSDDSGYSTDDDEDDSTDSEERRRREEEARRKAKKEKKRLEKKKKEKKDKKDKK